MLNRNTLTSADLRGVVDVPGTGAVDKLIDLLPLRADPLKKISNIRRQKIVPSGRGLPEAGVAEGLGAWWEMVFLGERAASSGSAWIPVA